MLTQYRLPLRKGDWVYITKVIDKNPVGTYGKFEKFVGELLTMHPKMGTPIRVHPDDINKLSIEEIRSKDDEFMLIEAMDDVPAYTRVHFVSGLGDDSSTCFTADGRELLNIPYSNLMRVIEKEEDNPIEWFIQHINDAQDAILRNMNILDFTDLGTMYRELTDLELFLILHPGNTLCFYEQLQAEMNKLLQQHVLIIANRGVLKNLTIASRIMRDIEKHIVEIEEASKTIQGEE